MTDGEVLDLADAIGMDPVYLNRRKIGEAFNAEQIIAARKLLIRSATDVRNAMMKAADGSDAEVMAYAETKARHQMIQGQVAGITAEAGRALRAFRELEGAEEAKAVGDFVQQATGRTLFQLRREAQLGANLTTPQQISRFVDSTVKGKLRDAIVEYYINALISGPITHMRYSAGNALNALWTPLAEIPAAAAIGKVREIAGMGPEDRVYLGEAGAQLWALGKGSREGLRAAISAFRSGVSEPLPAERVAAQFMTPKHAIPGIVGEGIRIPGRSVAAIHSFFKALRYEQNIQGLAYREAMKADLTGEAFALRVAELTRNPTPEMMENATAHALRELYMAPTEYNSAAGYLTRFANSNLPAKIMMPFMKIGTQITRNAFIERTPLGLASKEVRGNLLGRKGGAELDFQAAKITTGVALMGTTSLMVLEGLATGDGPSNPEKRARWLLNHRPNTMQIGPITVPYQGLGSLGMLMRFAANMTETAQGWNEEDGGKLATSFLEGISKSVLDDNFMRGLKDALDAIYHPEEYGERYLENFATNWLPYSVGLQQVARQVDPYMRDARGIWEAAQRHIPLLSEGLQPRYDIFGQPIPNGAPLPNYANDPVVKRMEALDIGIGKLARKIRGVQLTEGQYGEYQATAGRLAKTMLDGLVSNTGFANLPNGTQIKAIHDTLARAHLAAQDRILMEYPSIIQSAIAAKKAALH